VIHAVCNNRNFPPPGPPVSCPQLVHSLPEDVKRSVDIHRHVLPAAGGASGACVSGLGLGAVAVWPAVFCCTGVAEAVPACGECAWPPHSSHTARAPGVAESVVAFVKEQGAELVVVGSRGMGAARSTLMSLIGLGSVCSKLRQPWGLLALLCCPA
jgi:hypothetical protein